ncbi:MAG: hypothetical protein H6765_04645 [Candidatus Peribacteria bacterium]|nr:MAG: hypothetical protein H6765_04645 [Candidatus Peribacteria bacterium]
MALFAIGTLPGLLALGLGTSFAKDHRKQGFELAVAALLIAFGAFTLRGTLHIWGVADALSQVETNKQVQESTVPTEPSSKTVERVEIGHN